MSFIQKLFGVKENPVVEAQNLEHKIRILCGDKELLRGDGGAINFEGKNIVIFPHNDEAHGMLCGILSSLGVTSYKGEHTRIDYARNDQKKVIIVDRKQLQEAITQSETISRLIEERFSLLMEKTDYFDTLEKSGNKYYEGSPISVHYRGDRTMITVSLPEMMTHSYELQELTEKVLKALGNNKTAEELRMDKWAPLDVRFSTDSVALLEILKLNPDRINYSAGQQKAY